MITSLAFNTESGYDRLYINDDNNGNSSGQYYSGLRSVSFRSKTSKVNIAFNSDSSVVRSGFKFYWSIGMMIFLVFVTFLKNILFFLLCNLIYTFGSLQICYFFFLCTSIVRVCAVFSIFN